MQIEIYSKILGLVLRHLLTILAGYLAFVGVDKESNSELVSVTVNILVPVVLLAIATGWSFLQKRTQEYLFKYALHAPVGTTAEEVKEAVAVRQPPATTS